MKIPLPSSADVGQIEAWVTSRPLRDLVRAFGGAWPTGSLAKILSDLDVFSQGVWDFRAGQERHLARVKDFDPNMTNLIMASCRALGLVDEEAPKNQTYTHFLVLGGLIRACIQRPEYAARLSTQVTTGDVTALGSFRPLTDVERSLATRLGLGEPVTEFDAMDAGMRLAFGLGEPVEVTEHVHRYTSETGPASYTVVAAPSSVPGRRANTADTYRYWAENYSPTGDLLLVTSTAYVPLQHCDALRILGLEYGCGIDTVGLAPTALPFTPANYLQEVRSAIRSMRALHAVLTS
ncbi:hypothetical protein Lfu02_76140 [Longispora fulva]|uniref:Uncharacterized protein n=1 Tax=Longispora fulva TaxID=619741 RepID=A0A8J7GMT5_9ACTN|nr:hypothetical protein [Longispora fulva]MBG6138395.1 hypothetical protein [Longispora fulva]GIG63242.1 hypothetical protein Lfu02_76140 [Longispora fulva]